MSVNAELMPAPVREAEASVTSMLAALWNTVPLDALLTAADAEVQEIDPQQLDANAEDWFFGYAVERKGGHVALVMPSGQPLAERDTIARDLLARMRGVQIPGQRATERVAA